MIKNLTFVIVIFAISSFALSQAPNIGEGVEFRLMGTDLVTFKGMARVQGNQLIFDKPLQSGEPIRVLVSDPMSGDIITYNALVGINVDDVLVQMPGYNGYVSLKDTLLQQNVRLALPSMLPGH